MASQARNSGATRGAVLPSVLVLGSVSTGSGGTVRGVRSQQVLSALAFGRGDPVPDDELFDVLWPDAHLPPDPATTLRTYVGRTRTAAPGVTIERTPTGYALGPAGSVIDVVAFETSADLGLSRWAAGDVEGCRWALGTASDLWRGSPWLALAGWHPADVDRDRLEELHRSMDEHLAAVELLAGAPARLIGTLRARTEAHPFREFGWELLIRALVADGRSVEALRAFQSYRRLLIDEMGVEPSEALRELDRAVVQQSDLPPLVPVPPSGPARSSGRRPTPPPSSTGPALAGRIEELDLLATTIDAVGDGGAHVLCVTGDAGIGKTRLLEELERLATAAGFRSVWGRCFEAEATGAFRSMIGPIDRLADAIALSDADRDKLARLLPSTAGTDDELADPRGHEQLQLFDAVADLIARSASDHGLLLVVDDVHWADSSSIDLLAHVVRHTADAKLLVAVGHREHEVGEAHPVSIWLGQVPRQATLTVCPLGGLGSEAATDLLRDSLGPGSDGRELGEIVEKAAGNPFFLIEFARALAATGPGGDRQVEAAVGSTNGRPLPAAIDRMLWRRISRFGAPAEELLQLVALSAGGLPLDLLTEVRGDGVADDIVATIDALVASGLLVEDAIDGEVILGFTHDLLRLAVLDRVGPSRRQAAHRRLAVGSDRLAPHHPDRWVTSAAFHWFGAGRSGDPRRAVETNDRAALIAYRRTAFADAAAQLERALTAVGWTGDDTPAATLHLRLAEAAYRLGDMSTRQAHAEAAFAEAADTADIATMTGAALVHGGSRSTYGRTNPVTTSLLTRADAAVTEGPDLDEARALRAVVRARLAQEINHAGDLDRSRAMSAEAMRLVEGSDDDRAVAAVVRERIWTLNHPDFLVEREQIIETLIERAIRLRDVELEMEGRVWRASALLERGDTPALDDEIARLTALSTELPIPVLLVRLLTLRSTRATMAGRFDEGSALATETYELGLRVEPDNAEQVLQAQMIAPLREAGALEAALPVVEIMADSYREVPGWHCALAFVFSEAGAPDRARAELDALGADGVHDIRRDLAWAQAMTYVADAACNVGHLVFAEPLTHLLAPFAGRNASLWDIASNGAIDHYLGRLARLAGDPDRAAAHLRDAVALNESSGQLPMALRSRVAAAELDLDGSRGDAARTELDDIVTRAESNGWLAIAGLARELRDR